MAEEKKDVKKQEEPKQKKPEAKKEAPKPKAKDTSANPMRGVRVQKVTLNIGVGEAGQSLENAKKLLTMVTEEKPIVTTAKVRNPVFKIKKGDPIGVKVTLRGEKAVDVLRKSFKAAENKILEYSFDRSGCFSFGVKEYIDYPGIKYDPKIGIIGFDVCVTLARPGTRVKRRRRAKARRISGKHVITPDESREFVKKEFGVAVVGKEELE